MRSFYRTQPSAKIKFIVCIDIPQLLPRLFLALYQRNICRFFTIILIVFELHIDVKISFPRVKVDVVHADGKHEGLVECGREIAWVLLVVVGLVEVDVLFVDCS